MTMSEGSRANDELMRLKFTGRQNFRTNRSPGASRVQLSTCNLAQLRERHKENEIHEIPDLSGNN